MKKLSEKFSVIRRWHTPFSWALISIVNVSSRIPGTVSCERSLGLGRLVFWVRFRVSSSRFLDLFGLGTGDFLVFLGLVLGLVVVVILVRYGFRVCLFYWFYLFVWFRLQICRRRKGEFVVFFQIFLCLWFWFNFYLRVGVYIDIDRLLN